MVRSSPSLSPLWFDVPRGYAATRPFRSWRSSSPPAGQVPGSRRVASSVQPPVDPAKRSVEGRLRIRPRSGGLEGRGSGEHGPVAMAPADDLKPHGQSRRGEADGDRRRRLPGEVERIGERDPAERADLAARDLLDAGPSDLERRHRNRWRDEEIEAREEA